MVETPASWWERLPPEEQQRHRDRWQKRDELLIAARAALPFPPGPALTPQQPHVIPTYEQSLDHADMYIRVGEPLDAWVILCHVAREVGASAECWDYLMQARELVGFEPPERVTFECVPEYALVLFELLARNRAAARATGTADPAPG